MTYQNDKKFLDAIRVVKEYGIGIDENGLEDLYSEMLTYQNDRNNPEHPVYLVVRELGSPRYIRAANEYGHFSDDVSTIVFEGYFSQGMQTLSEIFQELRRISKNNFAYEILNETKYNHEGHAAVSITFMVADKQVSLTHEDVYENGGLFDGFFIDELIPNLKNCINKGHILYIIEDFINFIYFQDKDSCDRFKKQFFYKEI